MTQSNGSGTTYGPGSTFTISANTELYPLFTANAPKITTTSLPGATICQTNYSATLQGTGGTTPYTWSISAGILPKGLTLNSSTGAITGTVSSQATTETFTVALKSASGATATKQLTITVYGVVQITTISLPGATIGQTNYSATLQGTGGTTPYAWSISTGNLPKGLTLNSSTGAITGTVSSQASTEIFTVTLKGVNGQAVHGRSPNHHQLVGMATIGQNYSATLQGTGGTTPYAWSISTGNLPKGLTLNSSTGAITGTVSSQASTEIFTVTLTSANGATTTKQFTISICRQGQH